MKQKSFKKKHSSKHWAAFFLPNRDHDYRHLPHPVEMGPQESWNSHPDCGEASGAPGHTGISFNSLAPFTLFFTPNCLLKAGLFLLHLARLYESYKGVLEGINVVPPQSWQQR